MPIVEDGAMRFDFESDTLFYRALSVTRKWVKSAMVILHAKSPGAARVVDQYLAYLLCYPMCYTMCYPMPMMPKHQRYPMLNAPNTMYIT